ncbi:MAG TPA: glycerophosphodiester phosphodiesterase [Gemmatimonadaceae bacterium]|nr:glycerophosphodiester phosphodiesterase [Gemmatimonadaceae bacterium]
MPDRPEIIAHRGASRERPENTLAAFVRAVEVHADAVELDVHLTRDGHLVVHHDPTAAGPDGRRGLHTLTLAEVAAFRVGGEPIPTLAAVIAAVGGRVRIYCELKGHGTAAAAVRALTPLGDAAAVHSFDHRMVIEARRLAPGVPRGVLESSYRADPTASLREAGARDLWQHETLIDLPLVAAVHAAGARLIAWTVNDAARMRDLAALGVDGICTDDAAAARAALAR